MTRRELERRERRIVMVEAFISGAAFVAAFGVIVLWLLAM
jgi:hypothetical protein